MVRTMVTEEIAYQWATNKILTDVKFLLLIYFRDPVVHKIENFEELLYHYYKSDKRCASNTARHIEDLQGKGLMLIFDGFDELPQDTNCKLFIDQLLQQRTLSRCYIVITSRSHITANLFEHCDNYCRVENIWLYKTKSM